MVWLFHVTGDSGYPATTDKALSTLETVNYGGIGKWALNLISGGVEMWRGGLAWAYLLADPFGYSASHLNTTFGRQFTHSAKHTH